MISAGLPQYTRSFGGKDFGEVLLFLGLDVRYPIALQSGLEVNLSGLQETAEAYLRRHDKDEAGHPVHPVGGFPLLEAAKQGLDNVRRHVVDFFVTARQGIFRCKVANHHASESRKSLAAPHEFLIDDCDTLHGRFPGEPGFLAGCEHFVEAGHDLAEFIHQSPALPDEGIHAALLGGKRADGFHHILGPLNPVEDVHPTCRRAHVIGHQVINIRKGVMPGAPDSLGERDKLLVPPVDPAGAFSVSRVLCSAIVTLISMTSSFRNFCSEARDAFRSALRVISFSFSRLTWRLGLWIPSRKRSFSCRVLAGFSS